MDTDADARMGRRAEAKEGLLREKRTLEPLERSGREGYQKCPSRNAASAVAKTPFDSAAR